MEQRRHFSRVLFTSQATLHWDNGASACEVSDLSLKGALIVTPPALTLRPGQSCHLELSLDGAGTDIISMDGIVAHHQANSLGLHSTGIDLDSMTHLRRLIELNNGTTEDLQRELSALTHE